MCTIPRSQGIVMRYLQRTWGHGEPHYCHTLHTTTPPHVRLTHVLIVTELRVATHHHLTSAAAAAHPRSWSRTRTVRPCGRVGRRGCAGSLWCRCSTGAADATACTTATVQVRKRVLDLSQGIAARPSSPRAGARPAVRLCQPHAPRRLCYSP